MQSSKYSWYSSRSSSKYSLVFLWVKTLGTVMLGLGHQGSERSRSGIDHDNQLLPNRQGGVWTRSANICSSVEVLHYEASVGEETVGVCVYACYTVVTKLSPDHTWVRKPECRTYGPDLVNGCRRKARLDQQGGEKEEE